MLKIPTPHYKKPSVLLKIVLLKINFWFIISLTLISIILILYLYHYKGISFLNKKNGFSETIFIKSLDFIFNIIGFLIVLIVFLIQYVASKIDTYELEKMPGSNKYFLFFLIILGGYILFNFFAIYLELTYPYTLISLIFSFSTILLVAWVGSYSFFYLDVSNIITKISDQIIQFIIKEKKFKKRIIFEIGYTDEFLIDLNKKILVLIKICKVAINRDENKILETTLKSLEDIINTYLEQSKHIYATKDVFLDKLNDQFNFILSVAFKSHNQKILENIAETIGNISVAIVEHRKGIGNINDFALYWTSTLKDLFIKSYHKERTIVCHTCLEKINAVTLLALEKGYHGSYATYERFLDEISKNMLKKDLEETKKEFSGNLLKKEQQGSAILLGKTTLLYQKHFLKILELAKTKEIIFDDYFIKSYFDKIIKIVNGTIDYTQTNKGIILAQIYGVDSFILRIKKIGLEKLPSENVKKGIAKYMGQLIRFNKIILNNTLKKNNFSVSYFLPETLFLITKHVDLTNADRIDLIKKLSEMMFDFLEKTRIKNRNYDIALSNKFEESVIDYLALLIYLHNDKPELIEYIVKRFYTVYSKLKKKHKKYEKELLKTYKEMKLFSCWIELFDNLKKINKTLIKKLSKDFVEPQTDGNLYFPLYEQYGYPKLLGENGLYLLQPSYMWNNRFKDALSKKLNHNDGKHYIEFHLLLKKQSVSKLNN